MCENGYLLKTVLVYDSNPSPTPNPIPNPDPDPDPNQGHFEARPRLASPPRGTDQSSALAALAIQDGYRGLVS